MTPARAVAIVRQIASALDAAHESGVTHRDVKPENILITRDDFAYLVDFGIANAATDEKLTELGTAVGTYAYMAPERFTNDEVTYRADVYALTCVLHECLTGSQPFPGDSVSVVITAHLMQPIPRPSEERPGIPAAFDEVVARGMAKKPEERYASAGDLALAANDALTHRDQDQAATILQRSEAATRPGAAPPAEPPARPIHQTPPPTPPPHHPSTPPPMPAARPVGFHTPPPPPTSGRPSGPMASGPPSGPMWTASPAPPHPPRARALRGCRSRPLPRCSCWSSARSGSGGWSNPATHHQSAQTTTTATETAETTTRRTPRTTTPTEDPESFDSKLLALLPRGYDDGVCEPVHPPPVGALATVDCRAASQPGGPTVARYSLFADQATLDKAFDDTDRPVHAAAAMPGQRSRFADHLALHQHAGRSRGPHRLRHLPATSPT